MGKIYLHVFVPLISLFLLNNLVLLTLEPPGYLIINLLSFGIVVTVSILAVERYQDKLMKATDHAAAIKEITKICSEIGKVDSKRKRKENAFGKGSLRRAFRVEERKAA